MFMLAPLLLALVVVVVFFLVGDQLSPEAIFLLGWTGGLSFAAFQALAVRWASRGERRGSRPDRHQSASPHPYERGRYF